MKTGTKSNPTEKRGVLQVMTMPQVLRDGRQPVAKTANSTKTQDIRPTQPDLKLIARDINSTFYSAKTPRERDRPPFMGQGIRRGKTAI